MHWDINGDSDRFHVFWTSGVACDLSPLYMRLEGKLYAPASAVVSRDFAECRVCGPTIRIADRIDSVSEPAYDLFVDLVITIPPDQNLPNGARVPVPDPWIAFPPGICAPAVGSYVDLTTLVCKYPKVFYTGR